MDFDIVVLGNALVDLLIRISDDNQSVSLSEDNKRICLKQGDKILAEDITFVTGGGACRVGISLSRLGYRTAILSEIGRDELSDRIKSDLVIENVNIDFLSYNENPTPFAVGINYKEDRTLLIHHVQGKHDFNYEFKTKWFYVASLSNPWFESYEKLVDYALKNNSKIAFNPGPAQLDKGRESYQNILEKSEILFVNKQEAITILQAEDTDLGFLLTSLKKIGPKIVVITNGREGAYIIDSNSKKYHSMTLETKVVERTGAGDAFAAGFINSYIKELDIETCIKTAVINSSYVVTEHGGVKGLSNKEEMSDRLSDLQNKIIIQNLE